MNETGEKADVDDKAKLQEGLLNDKTCEAYKPSGGGDQTSENSEEAADRGQWGSPVEFILTLVGYSVGLGNIWRFPYLCMRNGGGAFLIPYFLFMLVCGMPLFLMEVSIGQFSSLSALQAWRLSPLFSGVGYGMILVSGICSMYYNTIITWILYYLFHSFTHTLPWGSCGNEWNTAACFDPSNSSVVNGTAPISAVTHLNSTANVTIALKTPAEEFWTHNVLELTSGIHDMGGLRWQLVLCLLVAWLIVFGCLCLGVKSIGKVVYVTATLPYAILFVLFIRGVTLDGSLDGVKFYISPDWPRLLEFKVWGEAMLQIFFSLGPAWGGLITMASYNRFKNNVLRDTLIVCFTCCGTSFFSGFVIFSIIGFMAKDMGVSVPEVVKEAGPGLAFVAYPQAITKLPISPMWAVFFFIMLLTVGLDTQFGMVETLIAGVVGIFPAQLNKRKTLFTAAVCTVMFLLGLPFTCRGGMYPFQIFDWYSATFSLTVIALFECVAISYVYGVNRLCYDIQLMIGMQPHVYFKVCWLVVTPVTITMIIIFSSFQMSSPTLGDYEYPTWALAIGWIMAMVSIVPIPVCATVALIREGGSLKHRLARLSTPIEEWGPAKAKHREDYKYAKQFLGTDTVMQEKV